MHSQITRKSIVWMVVLTFTLAGATPAFSGSRIMPTGSVKVYKGKKLVQVLKQESAFPDGALLTTEGKCGVRSEGFYLVADDGCTFSIMDRLDRKYLRVDKGSIYFAITQMTGNLAFITPAGVISTQQILFNADTSGGILKGYLDVSGSQVQLGVLEGGSMVVKTSIGEKEILSGKQITLSMAEPVKKKGAKEAADKKKAVVPGKGKEAVLAKGKQQPAAKKGILGDIPATYLVGGAVLGVAAIVGIANAGSDSSTPAPASPASP
jgi:hypothetical protein